MSGSRRSASRGRRFSASEKGTVLQNWAAEQLLRTHDGTHAGVQSRCLWGSPQAAEPREHVGRRHACSDPRDGKQLSCGRTPVSTDG